MKEVTTKANQLMNKQSRFENYKYGDLFEYTTVFKSLVGNNTDDYFFRVLDDFEEHIEQHNEKSYGEEDGLRFSTPKSLRPIILNELEAVEHILRDLYEDAYEQIEVKCIPEIEKIYFNCLDYLKNHVDNVNNLKAEAVSLFNKTIVEHYDQLFDMEELDRIKEIKEEIDSKPEMEDIREVLSELESIVSKKEMFTEYCSERYFKLFSKIDNVEKSDFCVRGSTRYKNYTLHIHSLKNVERLLASINKMKSRIVEMIK